MVGDLRGPAGYWIGSVFDLPEESEIAGLALDAHEIATTRLGDKSWVREARRTPKSFYVNVLEAGDPLVPELVGWGQRFRPYGEEFLELSHVGVFVSGLTRKWPWQAWQGTQRPHFDVGDPKHVKLFVLLSEVRQSDGPLTFWPAEVSAELNRGRSRVDEAELLELFGGEAQTLTGPPGTAALVDVSRCIHYGSRGGRRQTLVLHWCTDALKYCSSPSARFADLNVAYLPRVSA